MDETELEEGEACFDDNDESIDPDTTFFYIDKRLQDMLGHFQKDFEGDISVELLGWENSIMNFLARLKFGGYVSFLPTRKQSSAVHSYTKTPQKNVNFNKPRSPDNFRLEGVRPAATDNDNASKDTS